MSDNKLRNAMEEDEMLMPDPEVEAAPVPDAADLKQVADVARRYVELEADIASLEEQLSTKKAALKAVREAELPLAMTTVGLESFQLVGGGKIELKKMIAASITEVNKEAAHSALERAGYGSIIKHEIKIMFGRGEEAWAAKFMRDLAKRKRPIPHTRRDFIEYQTLQKQAREMVEAAREQNLEPAEAIPNDLHRLLGIYELRYADLKLPKEAKT